jgi:5-methyltetrahydropteroyltriglutamate--homocysteine methyltransferase
MHTLKTTVVGSYPVPEWLKASPSSQALNDAIRLILDVQERAGLDVIGDGELGRWDLARREPAGMVERFVRPMEGVKLGLTPNQREEFRADPATAYRANAPGSVVGPLGEGSLDLLREYEQAQAMTHLPLKFTVTSPYMLARVVADHHYQDLEQLALSFADVLAAQVRGVHAAVLQIDEPHLPGHPDHSQIAAVAINRVLDAAESGVSRAVHLCFGNFGGQMIQTGHYRKLINFLNLLHCDHVVLETTRRASNEIDSLKEIHEQIKLGLGVIDVKDLQVETTDVVAARIEMHAERFGYDRLEYVHPDCGLQVLPRTIADAKLRALVSGRDLFLGKERRA